MENRSNSLIGQIFGRLTVIQKENSKHGRRRWLCLCECGKTCITSGKNLRDGKKKSCGCLRRELCKERARINSENNKLAPGEAAFTYLFNNYKYHAEQRNLEFPLSKEEFGILTKQPCFYCGTSPYQEYKTASKNGGYIYNGLDRQDNYIGYTKENTVACCGICNDMKRTRTVEKFIEACNAVVNHQNHKKLAEMTNSL